MISSYTQHLLSVLHERTPSFEPSFGDGSKSTGKNLTYQTTNTALGFVAKRDPLASALLSSVYLDAPEKAYAEAISAIKPADSVRGSGLHESLVQLALVELNSLLGSNRCGCGGRNKTCEMCDGTGIRPNRAFSERNRVSLLQRAGADITRWRWRNGICDAYDSILNELIERLSVGALLFRSFTRGGDYTQ